MRAVVICAIVLSSLELVSAAKKAFSDVPLTDDQIAIYHTFLSDYSAGANFKVNVSRETSELLYSDLPWGSQCLDNIQPIRDKFVRLLPHKFDMQFNDLRKLRLVNPDEQLARIQDPGKAIRAEKTIDQAVSGGFENGLLTLSEIAFDRTGHFAIMKISFYCGGLCGHGSNIVFEKTRDGQWKQTKRQCSGWVS